MHAVPNQEDRFEASVAGPASKSVRTGDVKVSATLAKMLVELDTAGESKVYVIKSPMAGTEYAIDIRGEKNIYGVRFVEGIGVTADEDLARRIHSEFPDYSYSAA